MTAIKAHRVVELLLEGEHLAPNLLFVHDLVQHLGLPIRQLQQQEAIVRNFLCIRQEVAASLPKLSGKGSALPRLSVNVPALHVASLSHRAYDRAPSNVSTLAAKRARRDRHDC